MAEAAQVTRCHACGTELSPSALACPACRALVHAAALNRLAAEARRCEESGDAAGAALRWREALPLLPPGTRQREAVAAALARSPAAPGPARSEAPAWVRRLGPVAVIGFGAWKLLGLAKLAPLLSLLASFAVYWQTWGWAFAAAFLASIYVHELGHVLALRRAGIPASAPMFIPGVGAFVRMHRAPPDALTGAWVGLAGPVAGLAAALAAYAAFAWTGAPLALAVAHAGAVINLFNLIPLGPLDGGRGFDALSAPQRFFLAVLAGGALYLTGEGLLWLLVIGGGLRAFSARAPARGDPGAFGGFALLVAALSWLAWAAR